MEKEAFDALFHSTVAAPLAKDGFNVRGKSLFYDDGVANVSLLRLGGRMALPGAIAHVLCFRHSILPDLEERIPEGLVGNVFAYPYKFKPAALFATDPATWAYMPQNLNYEYETYSFRDKSTVEATDYLDCLEDLVGGRFLFW